MGPRKSANEVQDAAVNKAEPGTNRDPEPTDTPSAPKQEESSASQATRSNARVITGLLLHSVAMVFVPWLIFGLISYGHLDPALHRLFGPLDKSSKNTLAAVAAVLAVNVVVGNFIFRAFREDDSDQKAKQSKKRD